jgi:citrate synthase
MATYLSAREAAAELGVSLPTLYAYVSRGQIRSEREGAARQRRYLAEDVWLLNARKRGPARPGWRGAGCPALGHARARVAALGDSRRPSLLRRA